MWNYEKRLLYPVNDHPHQPKMAPGHHFPVRRPGRRTRRLHAVSLTALHHAVQRSNRDPDRHRHRRSIPFSVEIILIGRNTIQRWYNIQYSRAFDGPGNCLHLLTTADEAVFFSGNDQCLITSHFSIILQIIPLPILFMPVIH